MRYKGKSVKHSLKPFIPHIPVAEVVTSRPAWVPESVPGYHGYTGQKNRAKGKLVATTVGAIAGLSVAAACVLYIVYS